MPSPLTLEAMVSRLESQIAFHREREAFHAEQENLHRDQRVMHAAELEALTTNLEALKAAAETAVKLVNRPGTSPPLPESATDFIGRKPSPVLMVKRVVEARPASEVFGPSAITAEVNRRYQDRLRRPVKEKVVSIVLRRLLDTGAVRLVREGRPHHEAQYARATNVP